MYGSPLTRTSPVCVLHHTGEDIVLDPSVIFFFWKKKNSFGLGKGVSTQGVNEGLKGTKKKDSIFFTARAVVEWIDYTTTRTVYVQSRTVSLHIDGCRCNERLKPKTEGPKRLVYTGFWVKHIVFRCLPPFFDAAFTRLDGCEKFPGGTGKFWFFRERAHLSLQSSFSDWATLPPLSPFFTLIFAVSLPFSLQLLLG
jgi:hypothetical protein